MPPKRLAAGRRSGAGSSVGNGVNGSNDSHNAEAEFNNSGAGDGSDAVSSDVVADHAIAIASSNALEPSPSDAGARSGRSAGASRGRGGRLLSQPKFAGRRSAAARLELEKAEAEKKRAEQAAREPENPAAKRGPRRGDGGRGGPLRGRGRGGYVGESDRKPADVIASGPFSAGLGAKGSLKSGPHGGSGHLDGLGRPGAGTQNAVSGPFTGEPRLAKEGIGWSTRSKVKAESDVATSSLASGSRDIPMAMDEDLKPIIRDTQDGGYISSDEDEMDRGAGRLNVEDLTMIDLTGDDDINPYVPVRIARVTHKGRSVGLNTKGPANKTQDQTTNQSTTIASSPEKKQQKPKAKDVEIVSEKQRFMSVYDDSSDAECEPHIKPDPDGPAAATPIMDTVPVATNEQLQAPLGSERNRKGKERAKAQSSSMTSERPDYQTQEEIDEWERIQRDLQILKSELGGPFPGVVDNKDDTSMAGAQPSPDGAAKRDNRVYLFQFPPVLPDLLPVQVKADPENLVETISSARGDTATGLPMHVDDPTNVADGTSDSANVLTLPKLSPGYVGKLKIHASGRATLDWGGTSLCLSMGASTSFLQDIMVAKLPDAKSDAVDGNAEEAVAMSMGQVKGKFIVTPDFEKILQ